jgi:RHS repeat-associated protein
MPFGGKRGEGTGITASNYLFTDQELDAESGLYNYDARLYDPIIGRFASADSVVPMELQSSSFDRYAYCMNNPLNYVDPSGHHNQEYGPNMGGFGGLGIGNPGSYGGDQTVSEIGLTDENITNEDENQDFAVGFNYGYWSKVLSEAENDRFIYQDIIDQYGKRFLQITPKTKTGKTLRTPFEEWNQNYIKSKLPFAEEDKKAIMRACTCLTIGYISAGVLTNAAVSALSVDAALSVEVGYGILDGMNPSTPASSELGQAISIGKSFAEDVADWCRGE